MLRAHIIKRRRDLQIDVSLELNSGGALGLFGPSGAGKSTVLACLAGFEEPDGGFATLDNRSLFPPFLPLHRRPLGYLTQEPNLFPHLTVAANVQFGISKKYRSAGQEAWIETLKEQLYLGPLWRASAAHLSGGQARRVSLARTLAPKPPLLLLDEPFAGLDRQLTRELVDNLLSWNRSLNFSLIAVDHAAEVLEHLCPARVIALEQGRVVQQGGWEELRRTPATALLQSLLAPV